MYGPRIARLQTEKKQELPKLQEKKFKRNQERKGQTIIFQLCSIMFSVVSVCLSVHMGPV